MKPKHLKIITIVGIIGICLIIYITRFNLSTNKNIDMTGNEDAWRASLNVQIDYNNELVITLITEEFKPPSEVFVDILVKDKSVYNSKLKREQDDFLHAGIYKEHFDSIKHLERNYEDVSVLVSVNDETIKIPLNSIEIIE